LRASDYPFAAPSCDCHIEGKMTEIIYMTSPAFHDGYRPFPNKARRNATQEAIEIPVMVRALKLPKGKRILEVGCGRGVALAPLAKLCRPARLVGLDIDGELLAEAEERIKTRHVQAELYQHDVRLMPFADESFDLVIDFGTCYHITQPERALREIARVLCAGGMFVHETPVNQLLTHAVRSFGRRLPWVAVPDLVPQRHAVLWASRLKQKSIPF
jgi:SAM-dependent methyltransferase